MAAEGKCLHIYIKDREWGRNVVAGEEEPEWW